MQVICESIGWRSEVGSEASDGDGSGKIWVWSSLGTMG
jgi:hypothetical protein